MTQPNRSKWIATRFDYEEDTYSIVVVRNSARIWKWAVYPDDGRDPEHGRAISLATAKKTAKDRIHALRLLNSERGREKCHYCSHDRDMHPDQYRKTANPWGDKCEDCLRPIDGDADEFLGEACGKFTEKIAAEPDKDPQ